MTAVGMPRRADPVPVLGAGVHRREGLEGSSGTGTTDWMTDIEACVEFVYLVDECAVDDPAIRPYDEAPFDCCGVEDSFTAPECK